MAQVDDTKRLINDKEATVKELDDEIAALEHSLGQATIQPKPVQKVRTYKVAKGDEVDEMLAQYINAMRIELPISRLGGGQYMFGSKKIYAKVMNNKLVVRVGGGYMDMNEFIQTYAESERLKLQHMDPAEVERLHQSNQDKRIIETQPLSTRARSPKVPNPVKSPRNSSNSARKLGGSFVGK